MMVTVNTSTASCPGQLTLKAFSRSSYSETCCAEGSLSCAGCASHSGSSCTSCAGGFLKMNGKCTSCADAVGWVNRQGRTCAQLTTSDCDHIKVKGLSSTEACCICDGGSVTPTPFAYDMKHWALGQSVSLKPHPRTAERYSLNEGCQLAEYNLTMNGNTGEVFSVPGTTVSEPFSLECTVTAHQTPSASYEATVRVSMDFLAYDMPLLFSGSSFTVAKAAGTWKDFKVICAPEATWLSISSTGTLSRTAVASKGGVETEESGADLAGQMGGVCAVSAQHQAVGDTKWQERKAKVVAIWPKPWPNMAYDQHSVSVTLGEQLPTLKASSPSTSSLPSERWLKPSDFQVACDASPLYAWSFDTLLGTGLLEGHLER